MTQTKPVALNAATPVMPTDLNAVPFALRGVTVGYGDQPVVLDIDMTARSGRMTAIIGPNGAGKSTLLKAALGIVPRLSGQVTIFGQPFERQRGRVAYVPQRAAVDWDFPTDVLDVVLMGMTRELGLLRRVRPVHRDRALDCLDRVGMRDFARRQIGQLSGGQQQRVFLARALAQQAEVYLLDEPFAGVDVATERAIIGLLHGLRDEGRTIVCVHHDLSTVARNFDDVFLINRERIAEGTVAHAFTPEALHRAYGGRLDTAALAPGAA